MKYRTMTFFAGLFCGAALFGGASAVAAGITAQPAWSPIYVDGQQVQMTAYNILGNNYVKLRDIGQAVGFNVYYQNGVQVDSTAPYTGEAPAQIVASAENSIQVSSYKGNPLKAGDRSGLMIGPSGTNYTVTSSNPAVIAIENVAGNWVVVAKAGGSATITATDSAGNTGTLILTVTGESIVSNGLTPGSDVDLSANMEIRQEMIRLINQVRRENGVAELVVNEALMNAAQDCSAQGFLSHNTEYECKAAMAYGYPHGFGDNYTRFNQFPYLENVAQTAVTNWVESPGHFATMIDPACDTLGVGVTIRGQEACCYMFAGDPNSHHPYE